MPFSIRPFRRFPVQCSVTYHAGPYQGQGTVWNLSCTGLRLSGDLPMRPRSAQAVVIGTVGKVAVLLREVEMHTSAIKDYRGRGGQ